MKCYKYIALDLNLKEKDDFYRFEGYFSIKDEVDVNVVIDNMSKVNHKVISIEEVIRYV